MPYSLKDRRVLITGGSRQVFVSNPRLNRILSWCKSSGADCRGLGALIAEKFAAEGCLIAINYVWNLERARETAVKIEELESYEKKVVLVQGVSSFIPLFLSTYICRYSDCPYFSLL